MSKKYVSLLVVVFCLACVTGMMAQKNPNVVTSNQISKPIFSITPPLRDLVKNVPQQLPFGFHQAPAVQQTKPAQLLWNAKHFNYAAQKDALAKNSPQPPTIPTLEASWLGVGIGFFGYSVPDAPTDGNLSIGDDGQGTCQVVQWVNVSFAVFDCAGNNILFNGQHFAQGNVFWTTGPCSSTNSGDIIAQYDKMAHRWVMMQPRFSKPYYDCIAISQTSDATGAYYTYQFPTLNNTVDFPDYPKVSVWPNGYYVSHNDFPNLQNYAGVMLCGYDRVKMLAGDPSATGNCVLDNSNGTLFDDAFLCADVDDANAPPTGIDPICMGSVDNFATDTNEYYYPVHYVPGVSISVSCVNGACKIPVAAYSDAAGTAPEPGGNVIDTLSDRLMYRLAYRILPAPTPNKTVRDNRQQDWLVSHAVNNGGVAAVRWYEFKAPIDMNTPAVYQQGTYTNNNDGIHRFMSSLARDSAGNIAMSYTDTSASVFPTIGYTGRAGGDPLGTMGPDTQLLPGVGSQTDTSNRWGDYYNMSLSNDGCTFVTTGEWYMSTASFHWSTQIGKLKFDNCIPH